MGAIMEAINWEAVSAVSEALGLMVVFISLVYLALQVRQSTIAQQGSTHHQFLNTQTSANRAVSGSAEVCELIDRAGKDFSGITSAERFRLIFIFFDHFNQWEFAFDSRRESLLKSDIWNKVNKGYSLCSKRQPGILRNMVNYQCRI